MARQMNLQLVIGADGRAVAPVTAEVRREVSSVGEAGRAAAADVALLAAANDEAAAASRRAMEAMRGQATAERDLRASIERSVGVRPALDDAGYRQRQADIAAFGAELDRLRAKFVPAAAAEQSLLAVQNEINRAFKVGAIDAKEQAAALEMARLAHDHTAAAAARQAEEYRRLAAAGREAWAADQAQARFNSFLGIGAPAAGSARASADVFAEAGLFDEIAAGADRAAQSTALATHEMTNLTYQMNDIVLMLASGQSPFLMMMQQGSQITQIMGQRGLGEILPALGGALTKLISPTTMFLAGITAAGYAGYAAFRLIKPAAVDAEAALERHADLLEKIRERYKLVEDTAKSGLGISRTGDLFEIVNSLREMEFLLQEQGNQYRGPAGIGNVWDRLWGEAGQFDARWALGASNGMFAEVFPIGVAEGRFKPFEKEIVDFLRTAKDGLPDFMAFRNAILERWNLEPNNAQLTKTVRLILDATEAGAGFVRRVREMEDLRWRLEAGQRGALIGSPEEQDRNSYLDEQRLAIRQAQLDFEKDIQGLSARSPAELAAVARRREELRIVDGENDDVRRHRIELAERRALAEAEHALAEASRERARALSETLASARLDLDLVGKSAVEVDRLRMEHQLLSELRREAAQNGVEASQQEIDAIRAAAAETANLRAIAGARELIRTKAEELEMLRVETALVGASDAMRAQLLARLDAERDIRERGIDAMGEEAQRIRAANAALAEQQTVLERLEDAWGAVQSAGESMIDTVFDRLLDGDLEGALRSIGDEMLKLSMQLGVTNPLKNAVFGTNYGTFGDLGGWSGIAGRLFGGGDRAAASMFGGQAVASMSVSAGTVILSGDLGVGGGTGGLAGNLARLLTGANDNSGSVQETVWNFFRGKGLASHQIAGIMGHVSAESAFNPLAVGDGGASLGLFQNHASRASGLLGFLGGQGNLGNVQGQLEYAWRELLTTERRALDALLSSRNVQEATAAFGGFERPSGYNAAVPEAMHNWTGRLREAERAMERFGNTAFSATGDLQAFGGGLGEMGRNLANAFPPAPSGGGWLSGLGSLFGLGGGGASLSPAAWAVVSSGRMTGLFDQGGPTGGTDPTRIAGFVHEQEYVFDAVSTRRIGVGKLDAIRRGALNGYREGGYAVADGIAPGRGGSGGGGQTPAIRFEVVDRAGVTIQQAGEARQDAGGDLTIPLLINQLEEKMVASMQGGALGRATQQTFGLARGNLR